MENVSELIKGKNFEACLTCKEYSNCLDGKNKCCLYNEKTNRNKLQWRYNFNEDLDILDSFTYGDIILALKNERPENRDEEKVKDIVIDILECRLQDLWYLVELNMDQILNAAK